MILRRLLLIVLCLALPWQGALASAAAPAPCPMAEMGLAAADPAASGLSDCCADEATFAATGHPCKANLDCASAAAALLAPASPTVQPPPDAARIAAPALPQLVATPPAVWRPPTLS